MIYYSIFGDKVKLVCSLFAEADAVDEALFPASRVKSSIPGCTSLIEMPLKSFRYMRKRLPIHVRLHEISAQLFDAHVYGRDESIIDQVSDSINELRRLVDDGSPDYDKLVKALLIMTVLRTKLWRQMQA